MIQNCYLNLESHTILAGSKLQGFVFFSTDEISQMLIRITFQAKISTRVLQLIHIFANDSQIPQGSKARLNTLEISQESMLNLKSPNFDYMQTDQGNYLRVMRNYGDMLLCKQTELLEVKSLPPGQHKIPFMFETQPDWPSSFFWELNTEFLKQKAKVFQIQIDKVAYEIKCEIESDSNLSQTQKLFVNLNQKTIPEPLFIEIKSPIIFCFCFPRGVITIQVYLQKNVYQVSEKIPFTVQVDNSFCKSKIGPITYSVRSKMTLIDESGFERIMESILFESVHNFQLEPQNSESKPFFIDLKVPTINCLPTVHQPNLQNKNFLVIQVETPKYNTQSSELPFVQVPIIIVNQKIKQQQLPIEWCKAQIVDPFFIDTQQLKHTNEHDNELLKLFKQKLPY